MKLGFILAIIVAVMLGAATAAKVIYDAGFNDANRINAAQAEKDRAVTQTTINLIEKQAVTEAQKAADAQVAHKVEKAIENARAANPACSLLVPNTVKDALKHH